MIHRILLEIKMRTLAQEVQGRLERELDEKLSSAKGRLEAKKIAKKIITETESGFLLFKEVRVWVEKKIEPPLFKDLYPYYLSFVNRCYWRLLNAGYAGHERAMYPFMMDADHLFNKLNKYGESKKLLYACAQVIVRFVVRAMAKPGERVKSGLGSQRNPME